MNPRRQKRGNAEYVAVAIITLITTVLFALPSVYGWWVGVQAGKVWNGMVVPSEDYGYYLSLIEQVRQGGWFLHNLFTTEPTTPIIDLFWLVIGWFARVSDISSFLAYHAARVMLVPVLCIASYGAFAYFLKSRAERLVAWTIFLYGSSIAPFFYFLDPVWFSTAPVWEKNPMLITDSNLFMTMNFSPHFIASLALVILSLVGILRAFERQTWRSAAAAGGIALLLVSFHPYHVFTLLGIPFAYLVLETAARRVNRNQWRAYFVFACFCLPPILYFFFVTHALPEDRAILAQSLTLSGPLWALALSTGALLWMAPFGLWVARRRLADPRARYLMLWVILTPLMIYLPLGFQRRLIEGWLFPLSGYGAIALLAAAAKMLSWAPKAARGLVIAVFTSVVAALFLPTSVFIYATQLGIYRNADGPVYLTSDAYQADLWMQHLPLTSVIICAPVNAYLLPGFTGRRVYAGHWANTIDHERKRLELIGFYSTWTDEQRRAFVEREGITDVYVGPIERSGGWNDDAVPSWLTLAYVGGDYRVYEVRLNK